MLKGLKRWYERVFGSPLEGSKERAGENTDAGAAAASGSQRGGGGAMGIGDHGNIPPNYLPPTDEGRPRY